MDGGQMTGQAITLRLPEHLYARLEQRAKQTQRAIEEEALDALASAVMKPDELPPELAVRLAGLAALSDEELWRLARSRFPDEASDELEALSRKKQLVGLTPQEARTLDALIQQFDQVLVTRAYAALELKQRGHDVDVLLSEA